MCPVGSQFFVRNLFYNVPARRRFLDKSTTSAAQIKSEFQRVALCNPQIAFELYANDARSIRWCGVARRTYRRCGGTPYQAESAGGRGRHFDRPHRRLHRPSRRRQTAQRRTVPLRQRPLFQEFVPHERHLKAYEKLIPESSSPSYFLYLTIDPSRIDVNVHPQKTEVKFADEEAVWQIVNAAVRETLAKTGAVPLMDFDREGIVEIPLLTKGASTASRWPCQQRLQSFPRRVYRPFGARSERRFHGFDVPFRDGGLVSDSAARDSRTGGVRSAAPSFPQAAAGGFALPGADAGSSRSSSRAAASR